MKFRSLTAALAALTLTAAPVAAGAASADLGRALAPVSEESAAEGSSTILLLLAAAAIIAGIVVLGGNSKDKPSSP